MKYTGRILLTIPMIGLGSFWLLLLRFFPQITVQPVHLFLFALFITPILWFAGKHYDKSNHLKQKLKKQSDELAKRKNVLQEVFDNVDAMLWIEDLKTRDLLVSSGIARIFGYEPNDFSENSQLWFQGIHPEDKDFMASFYEDVVSGNNRKAELRIIKTNGDVSWVAARATPIFDEDGKVVKQTGVMIDISERKKLEREIIESEERYRTLTELSPDSIIIHQDGEIAYANPSAVNTLCATHKDEVIGRPILDFVYPGFKEQLDVRLKELTNGKTLRFAESKVIGLDGKTRDVEAISILTQLNGKPSVMTVGRDITERKRLEKAFKVSEEQYRKLVEFSPNGVIIHNFSEITYVNPTGVRTLGAASLEDLAGKSILDLIPADFHELVRERWEIIRKDKKPVEFLEEKMLRLDHQTIDVEIMGIPMTFNGEPHVQMFFRDITDRKKAQKLIYELAYNDPLTGLPNRRSFKNRLHKELRYTKAYKQTLAVMFLDLDGFKEVNDTLGHESGDLLLKAVAERFKTCLRAQDILSRFAGDEFTILLPALYEEETVRVAERIVRSLETPFEINGKEVKVTSSIGISFYPSSEDDEKLLKHADMAMYIAKQKGKNTYHIYK